MTKVSVVIPMYNEERYIWRCLESLKKQTFKDFEVILIDDCSKDNTIKIAESFNKDLQLKILKQQHWWPWKARNWWAKESEWDILIFVDADMYFDRNFIKNLIQPIVDWREIWSIPWTELVWNQNNSIAIAYSPVRCLLEEWSRHQVYRAIKKESFIKWWGFNTELWYADDNLSHINWWKWSYCVKNAICYHNNPESFVEIFKHEMWVGSSFSKFSVIKPYIDKYKTLLIITTILLIVAITLLILLKKVKIIPRAILILFLLFLIYKTFQRNKLDVIHLQNVNKKYLLLVWPVLVVRWFWIICWFIKWLFKRKIY